MKKLLLMLACLMSAVMADAQDIIVKSDGSTIQAKVQKVTSTEVEYKKFSNQDGPTYTIKTSELLSINYQNGEKDTFGGSTEQNSVFNPNIVTNETATRFSNDRDLMRIYNESKNSKIKKKARTFKRIGLIGGGALLALSVIPFAADEFEFYDDDLVLIGCTLAGFGLIGGTTCFLVGQNYSNKAKKVTTSVPIFEDGIIFSNGNSLALGVDALNDNVNNSRGLGVGLRFNF